MSGVKLKATEITEILKQNGIDINNYSALTTSNKTEIKTFVKDLFTEFPEKVSAYSYKTKDGNFLEFGISFNTSRDLNDLLSKSILEFTFYTPKDPIYKHL